MSYIETPERLIQIVEIVEAVVAYEGAKKRRPEPWRTDVTYFSKLDLWIYEGVADTKICDLCRRWEEHGEIHGHQMRGFFPYLKIEDRDTISPNVHPNCRCILHRLIEESE